MIRIAATVLVMVVLEGCARVVSAPQVIDDQAVLKTLLEHSCHDSGGRYALVSTRTYSQAPDSWAELADLSGASRDLARRNSTPSILPLSMECSGVRLVSEGEIEDALRSEGPALDPPNPGWEGFFARFPGARAVLRLTLPGYSRDGRSAVVVMSSACGSMCGFGYLFVLEKVSSSWKIVQTRTLWQV